MTYTPPDLKTALHIDLEAKGLTQDDMGRAMGVSQQSVSKWIAAQKIPEARVEQLRQLLGPDSYTVQFLAAQYQRKAQGMAQGSAPATPTQPGLLQQEPPVYVVDARTALAQARRLLPVDLQHHVITRRGPSLGVGFPTPDYESPTTVLCAAGPDTAHDAMITLLLHQRMTRSTKRLVLALVEMGGERTTALRLAAACAALGVVLMPCQSAEELAQAIQDLEQA